MNFISFALISAFVIVFAVGCVGVWLTMKITRHIQNIWLRQIPRSLVIAAAFTPTVVPIRGMHSMLPMPASWAVIYGFFDFGSEDQWLEVRAGGIPLLITFSIVLFISVVIAYERQSPLNPR